MLNGQARDDGGSEVFSTYGTSSIGPSTVHIPADHRAHVHAVSERYESLNYETIENTVYLNEIKSPKLDALIYRKAVNRWFVCFLSGLATACIGAAINIVIEHLIGWKFSVLQTYFNDCVDKDCMYLPLLVWVLINCAFTTVSVCLILFVSGSVGAGSGIPQIKCFLNGVKIPGVVSLKTLLAKCVGVLCSVAGGLSVGKEGPMIHSGACVAARISQGKTADGQRRAIDCHVFHYYRTDTELRDFVAAGAATGVAAAFGAPIGGVLFSLEEGASFWNQSLTWRMFFASMTCAFFLNMMMAAYQGMPGILSWMGLFNFGNFPDTSYSFWDFVVFMLFGVCGGIFGALFNYLNYKLTLFRISYGSKKWQKLFEALVIASASAIVGYLTMVFSTDCKPYQTDLITKHPVKLFCPEGTYSAAGALFMQSPEDAVISNYHKPLDAYSPALLSVYIIEQFLLSLWTYGIAVSSGLFIPSLLIGAAWGRLCSLGLQALFPGSVGMNTGLYALVGSAAQLAGNVRMTISLCVILLEATGELSFGLPLMVVLMISKWVGDLLTEGIYDIHIGLAEVPILAFDPPHLSSQVPAKKVMARPVKVLREIERVGIVYDLLLSNQHNAYPVVVDYDPETEDDGSPLEPKNTFGRLHGVILRLQLIVLLESKAFSMDYEGRMVVGTNRLRLRDFRDEYPKYERVLERITLSPGDRECWMDLRPFMNAAPFSVPLGASLRKMYQLFRGLGLRHIVVVNDQNFVVGIVTRKDIARYRAERKKGRLHLQELLISEVPFNYMGT